MEEAPPKKVLLTMYRRARRVAARARTSLERLLHPARRRRAIAILGSAKSTSSGVLFICYGNICRSPYAKGAFERLVRHAKCGPLRADSAGFIGPDRAANPTAHEVALRRGVNLTDHRSKVVTESSLAQAPLVVVMEPWHARALRRRLRYRGDVVVLGDLFQPRGEPRRIPDPYGYPTAVFERGFDRIDACLRELLAVWCPGPARGGPSDAPDPAG